MNSNFTLLCLDYFFLQGMLLARTVCFGIHLTNEMKYSIRKFPNADVSHKLMTLMNNFLPLFQKVSSIFRSKTKQNFVTELSTRKGFFSTCIDSHIRNINNLHLNQQWKQMFSTLNSFICLYIYDIDIFKSPEINKQKKVRNSPLLEEKKNWSHDHTSKTSLCAHQTLLYVAKICLNIVRNIWLIVPIFHFCEFKLVSFAGLVMSYLFLFLFYLKNWDESTINVSRNAFSICVIWNFEYLFSVCCSYT